MKENFISELEKHSLYSRLYSNLKTFDLSKNYIHFYCREYLNELSFINDENYELSNLALKNKKCKKNNMKNKNYGYFMLHFGINKHVINYFKEELKQGRDTNQKIKNSKPKSLREENLNVNQKNLPLMNSNKGLQQVQQISPNANYQSIKSINHNKPPPREIYDNESDDDKEIDKPTPIAKLISKIGLIEKEMILKLNSNNCVSYFARMELITLSDTEEDYIIIKLFSSLNKDNSVYDEDENEIEMSICKKEKEEVQNIYKDFINNKHNYNDLFHQYFKISKIDSAFQLSTKKKKIGENQLSSNYLKKAKTNETASVSETFEKDDIKENSEHIKFNNKVFKAEEARKTTMDPDLAESILSMSYVDVSKSDNLSNLRKNFLNKNTNFELYINSFINLLFFGAVCAILFLNYSTVYIERVKFANNINLEYFTVIDITQDLIVLQNNYDISDFGKEVKFKFDNLPIKFKESKQKYANLINYTSFNYTLANIQTDYVSQRHKLMASFSNSTNKIYTFNSNKYYMLFLEYLQNDLNITLLNKTFTYTLKQVFEVILVHTRIRHQLALLPGNFIKYSDDVLKLLRDFSFLELIKDKTFETMKISFQHINHKTNLNKSHFLLIIMILCVRTLITLIRVIYLYQIQNKSISLLYGLDDKVSREISKGAKKILKLLSQITQDAETADNDEEIIGLKASNNDINNEFELDLSNKILKKNKNYIWQINWDIYIKVFFTLCSVSIICLIPFIFMLSNKFYDNKFDNFFKFIEVNKVNQINLLLLFSSFSKTMISTDSDKQKYFEIYQNLSKQINNVEYQSSKLIYDVVDSLNKTNSFITFFSYNVCDESDDIQNYKNLNTTNYIEISTRINLYKKYVDDKTIVEKFNNLKISNSTDLETLNKLLGNKYLTCSISDKSFFFNKGQKYIENSFLNMLDFKINFYMKIDFDDLYQKYLQNSFQSSKDLGNIELLDIDNKPIFLTKDLFTNIILINELQDDNFMFLLRIQMLMHYYINKQWNIYYIYTFQLFLDKYKTAYLTTFVSGICMFIVYMIANNIFSSYYNYNVIVENKKIFSLLPSAVILNNAAIYELFIST